MCFEIEWNSLTVGRKFAVVALFYFVFEGNFRVQAPPGGAYIWGGGRFNGQFFALQVWGAYIWRGFYMEGLIFGILRYLAMKLFYTVNINLHFSRLKGKTHLFRRLTV